MTLTILIARFRRETQKRVEDYLHDVRHRFFVAVIIVMSLERAVALTAIRGASASKTEMATMAFLDDQKRSDDGKVGKEKILL